MSTNTNTSSNVTNNAPTITTVTHTKVLDEAQLQTLVSGILANLDSSTSLSISGGTYTIAEMVGRIQERIAAAERTKASKNLWHSDVQAERQVAAALRPLLKGMQRFVQSRYGEDSAKLAEFGFTPRKPRQVSAKTKADAAVKATATRKARNTVGKKQRLAIKAPPPAANPPAVNLPQAAAGAHPTTGGAS